MNWLNYNLQINKVSLALHNTNPIKDKASARNNANNNWIWRQTNSMRSLIVRCLEGAKHKKGGNLHRAYLNVSLNLDIVQNWRDALEVCLAMFSVWLVKTTAVIWLVKTTAVIWDIPWEQWNDLKFCLAIFCVRLVKTTAVITPGNNERRICISLNYLFGA